MVYGCGGKTVKCLVGFFNLLAFITGAAILITCIVSYTNNDIRDKILHGLTDIKGLDVPKINSIDTILIGGMVVGSIIMMLGFLGCCGACFESKCLLIIFVIAMTLMVLVQVILAGVLVGMKGKITTKLGYLVNKAAEKAKDPEAEGHANVCNWFKDMDNNLHCCGANGTLEGFQCEGFSKCTNNETVALKVEDRMCRTKIPTALYDNIKTFGIVGLVFMVLEIAAIVFVSMLVCAMHRGQSLYERV